MTTTKRFGTATFKVLAHQLSFSSKSHNNMSTIAAKYLKAFLSVIIVITMISFNTANAQSATLNSRVAVVANDTKTNIWVSDFPKKTSVIVYDSENNLLSILTTNDFGAAYLSLPKGIKTGVIVKTLDGGITVSNKAVVKNRQEEQNMVATYQDDSNKA
jgi:hypothetical protein